MSPVSRRQFAAMLTSLGICPGHSAFSGAKASAPEVIQLSRNGWMPNNERLLVLIYRAAFPVGAKSSFDFRGGF
jgi:hypothetical protein